MTVCGSGEGDHDDLGIDSKERPDMSLVTGRMEMTMKDDEKTTVMEMMVEMSADTGAAIPGKVSARW